MFGDGNGGSPPPSDAHGDYRDDATDVAPGDNRSGRLTPGDYDYFRVTVDGPGRMLVYSSGSTDTFGRLEDRFGRTLADDDDGGEGNNFRIERKRQRWHLLHSGERLSA